MKQLWKNVKNCLTYMMAPCGAVILFPSFKNTATFHNKKCLKGNKEKIENAHERETAPRISDTPWDGNPHAPCQPRRHREAHRQAPAQRWLLSKEQCWDLMAGIKSPRPLDFALFLVKHLRKRIAIEYKSNFQSQLTTESTLVSYLC